MCNSNEYNQAINDCIQAAKYGGNVGIPGAYLPDDPKAKDTELKQGKITLDFACGWMKGLTFTTGQTPIARYNAKLLKCILADRLTLQNVLDFCVIPLDEAPKAYEQFTVHGVPKKYFIDPHGMLSSPA